jgi:retinol dehydrogenase 14
LIGLAGLDRGVFVITGGNSGIGRATALKLAEMGASVVFTARDGARGNAACEDIVSKTGNGKTECMALDVSSRESIVRFAGELNTKHPKITGLINNAGAVFAKKSVTPEGYEATFATDYLGPFRLTNLLLDALKAGAPSRIVNVTSGIQGQGRLNLDDLQSVRKYESMRCYANAKHMLTMFTYALARRLDGTGVTVNAVEPGFVATNLGRNSGSVMQSMMFGVVKFMQISPEKAAEGLVYLATSPEVDGVSGRCYAGKVVKETDAESRDVSLQERLWEATSKL